MKTESIEIQNAEKNIAILKQIASNAHGQIETLPSAHQEAAMLAMLNEQEICRLASRIEQFLDILVRDYTSMAETFHTEGVTVLYNIVNELPELKAQLKCRKESRQLYAKLLK